MMAVTELVMDLLQQRYWLFGLTAWNALLTLFVLALIVRRK